MDMLIRGERERMSDLLLIGIVLAIISIGGLCFELGKCYGMSKCRKDAVWESLIEVEKIIDKYSERSESE